MLTPEVVQHALARAKTPVTEHEIRTAARRAGAATPLDPADAAAAALLSELERGKAPGPRLGRVLESALADRNGGGRPPSPQERAAAPWLAASSAERGEALRDLLLLSDALPGSRAGPLRFPGIRTRRT